MMERARARAPRTVSREHAREISEASINNLIERRHAERVKEDGRDRPAKELWNESVAKHEAKQAETLAQARFEYHQGQAVRLRETLSSLVDYHEEQAKKYLPKGA
jgi:hypothetical protein